MKKVLSLVMAATVALSLSACGTRNNGMYDRTRTDNNLNNDVRRLAQPNNNNANLNYRDGVYTGYGNTHNNANEMARVVIRNGRIADIDLSTTDQQRGLNNTTGTRTGAGTATGAGNRTGMGNGYSNNTDTGIGGPGTTGEGTTGAGYSVAPGNTIENQSGIGVRTGTGINNGFGIGNGTNAGYGTGNGMGMRTGTEIPGGPTANGINDARTRLVDAMVRNQSYDVNVENTDPTLVGMIDNWKLAVRRALDQAR